VVVATAVFLISQKRMKTKRQVNRSHIREAKA